MRTTTAVVRVHRQPDKNNKTMKNLAKLVFATNTRDTTEQNKTKNNIKRATIRQTCKRTTKQKLTTHRLVHTAVLSEVEPCLHHSHFKARHNRNPSIYTVLTAVRGGPIATGRLKTQMALTFLGSAMSRMWFLSRMRKIPWCQERVDETQHTPNVFDGNGRGGGNARVRLAAVV